MSMYTLWRPVSSAVSAYKAAITISLLYHDCVGLAGR